MAEEHADDASAFDMQKFFCQYKKAIWTATLLGVVLVLLAMANDTWMQCYKWRTNPAAASSVDTATAVGEVAGASVGFLKK